MFDRRPTQNCGANGGHSVDWLTAEKTLDDHVEHKATAFQLHVMIGICHNTSEY